MPIRGTIAAIFALSVDKQVQKRPKGGALCLYVYLEKANDWMPFGAVVLHKKLGSGRDVREGGAECV